MESEVVLLRLSLNCLLALFGNTVLIHYLCLVKDYTVEILKVWTLKLYGDESSQARPASVHSC